MTPDPKTEALKPAIPDKIYLQYYGSEDPHCGDSSLDELIQIDDGDVTWCRDQIFEHDIVYTRADTPDRINQDYAQKRIAKLEAGAAAMREALEPFAQIGDIANDADCTLWKRAVSAGSVRAARAALASTAGTDFAERLRKAVEERVKAESLVAEWKGNFSFISNSLEARNKDALALEEQLAAVTAERDEAMAIRDQRANCGACGELRHTPWRDSEHGYVCLSCLGDAMSRLTAAESDRDALAKERDELQGLLNQIPNT